VDLTPHECQEAISEFIYWARFLHTLVLLGVYALPNTSIYSVDFMDFIRDLWSYSFVEPKIDPPNTPHRSHDADPSGRRFLTSR
jgi:hypothetical protein